MTSTPTCSEHRRRGSAGCWYGRSSSARSRWPGRRAGPTTWSTRWPTCRPSSTAWPDLDQKAPVAEEHQSPDNGPELDHSLGSGQQRSPWSDSVDQQQTYAALNSSDQPLSITTRRGPKLPVGPPTHFRATPCNPALRVELGNMT